MNKYFNKISFTFLFLGIVLGALCFIFISPIYQSKQKTENANSQTFLSSKNVSEEINNQINSDGNVVVQSIRFGENFFYVQAIGKDCGSCHQSYIYIFDINNRKVFEVISDDARLGFTTDKTFSIIEPIRKENEPLCCPTSHKTRVFNWNGDTFVETKIGEN